MRFLLGILKLLTCPLQNVIRKFFVSRALSTPFGEDFRIVIVGAGFSGICAGIKLKSMGITNFVIYDRAPSIGGTWFYNTYPGCACDVPARLYSYSFATHNQWSRSFPLQPEILSYLKRLVRQHDLTRHIHLSTEVVRAEFDESTSTWNFQLRNDRDGELVDTANVFISGLGQLNVPKMVSFDGMDNFQGTMFHSARWNHEFDVKGKKVGVIGTGPSSIQICPAIAESVDELYVFQRSISHLLPKNDRKIGPIRRFLGTILPFIDYLGRYFTFTLMEMASTAIQHETSPSFITEYVIKNIITSHQERNLKPSETCKDPDTLDYIRKITTPSFPLLSKRIMQSDDWFEMLKRNNVTVVTDTIDKFMPHGIRTVTGETIELDGIVFATGFKSNEFLSTLDIVGRNGLSLKSAWNEIDPRAYYGITVKSFPNMFILYGPNTNLGHNSIIFMIECQMNYVQQCLEKMLIEELKTCEVKASAQDEFNRVVYNELEKSVWASNNCKSNWYRNKYGHVVNNWYGSCISYWWQTFSVDWTCYETSK